MLYILCLLFSLALPKPPTSLVTSEVTSTSVKLTWNPGNVDPVDSYIIQYRKKYAAGAAYDERSDVEETEFTVLSLNAFTKYEFRVVAVNNIGRGIPSSPVDVTTGELGGYLHYMLFVFHLVSSVLLDTNVSKSV